MEFPKPTKRLKTKKRIVRVRVTPIKNLERELDALLKTYVILRDKKCVCCGTKENLTPGHLITRGAKSVRWDILNVACQCSGCNFKHEFRPEIYTQWFIKTYGNDLYDVLVERSRQPRKFTRTDLEQIKANINNLIAHASTKNS